MQAEEENDTEPTVLEGIKREEENFAFGTTDQSKSRRTLLLMRVVQKKKGGRQGESEKGGDGTSFLHRKKKR